MAGVLGAGTYCTEQNNIKILIYNTFLWIYSIEGKLKILKEAEHTHLYQVRFGADIVCTMSSKKVSYKVTNFQMKFET
jgi:hypothetical protein